MRKMVAALNAIAQLCSLGMGMIAGILLMYQIRDDAYACFATLLRKVGVWSSDVKIAPPDALFVRVNGASV